MGVKIEETEDSLTVQGTGAGGVPGGGVAAARLDHRIAMAFLCLGLGAKAGASVDDASPIDTSFPGFGALMAGLGARLDPAPA
jgi:3-phosphoshikimate 1-carboxyvinyltransferase